MDRIYRIIQDVFTTNCTKKHEGAVFILISIVAFAIFVVRICKTFWGNLKKKMIPPGAVNDATNLNDFCFYHVKNKIFIHD